MSSDPPGSTSRAAADSAAGFVEDQTDLTCAQRTLLREIADLMPQGAAWLCLKPLAGRCGLTEEALLAAIWNLYERALIREPLVTLPRDSVVLEIVPDAWACQRAAESRPSGGEPEGRGFESRPR